MLRLATIYSTAPLKVREDGADTPVAALKDASYAPTVGDRVAIDNMPTSNNRGVTVWIFGKQG